MAYRLLIVDDESYTREGIKKFVNWTKHNIEVVGDTDDGETAIPLLESLKPDIVLTDVKMPNMDGIQLARHIRASADNIKLIFISGYGDLEYLKKAIEMEAVDYILKPIEIEELEKVIAKTTKKLDKENTRRKINNDMEKKLIQSMPFLREKFFLTLINAGEDEQHKYLERDMDFLGIDLPVSGRFSVITVNIDNKSYVYDHASERDKQLLSFSILNICRELVDGCVNGYEFEAKKGEYVCILDLSSSEVEIMITLAGQIKKHLLDLLDISVTIAVGSVVDSLYMLNKSYVSALHALDQKIFLGKNKIITLDNLERGLNYKFDFRKAEKLLNVLRAADMENMIDMVEHIFEELMSGVDPKYIRNVVIQLFLIPSILMTELDINFDILADDEKSFWDSIFEMETLTEMKETVVHYFSSICQIISDQTNHKSNYVVEYVKSLLHEKYYLNLTIQDIASKIFLTPTYVCLIFKQNTGETINDYLTKVRMEKAKEMLGDNSNKIYDICQAIGYTAPSYFTRLFKKYTGLSPSEYKEKLLK